MLGICSTWDGAMTGSHRLEKACERALAIRSASYQSVASILKQGLDRNESHAAHCAQ